MRKIIASDYARRAFAMLGGASVFLVGYIKNVPFDTTAAIFGVCLALIIAGIFYFIYPFQERPLLKNRQPKSLKKIFSEHYGQSGISWTSFEEYWLKVADLLGESPHLLRPTDRFDKELKPRSPIDISNGDLADYVRECLGKDVEYEKVETLDSLITLLCTKGPQQQPNQA